MNKNLFVNSSIKPLPQREVLAKEDLPIPKLADNTPDLETMLVRENLLSSSKALKYKDQVANPQRNETPIVKSLFEFEENKNYKKKEEEKKPQLFGNPFKSSQEPEYANPFANIKKTENPFASGASAGFSNPFKPSADKVSPVF